MNKVEIDRLLSKLKEFDALRDSDRINRNEVNRIQAAYAEEWPSQLNLAVRNALLAAGIQKPYQHQADAITKALNGVDVVMESPTASGKTLAFVAPMLHTLKQKPDSHAMMLYPMKALAFDQREQIREICKPLHIESWPYDGDTGDDIKRLLRQSPPQILLTNPEYLNMSFLGSRESWDRHADGARFLRNLRFIVIDEMHEYRGFWGYSGGFHYKRSGDWTRCRRAGRSNFGRISPKHNVRLAANWPGRTRLGQGRLRAVLRYE